MLFSKTCLKNHGSHQCFFLPESVGVQLHNILQILHRIIHSFNGNVFAWTVECISASSKVRTGQSHEGKPLRHLCRRGLQLSQDSVRTAAQPSSHYRSDAYRLNHLSHITILLFHSKRHSTSPYFHWEVWQYATSSPGGRQTCTVMVAMDIVKACRGYISAHFRRDGKIPHTLLYWPEYLLLEACC